MGAFDKKQYQSTPSMAGLKPPASSSGSGSSGSGSSGGGGGSFLSILPAFFSSASNKPFVIAEGSIQGKSMAGAGAGAISLLTTVFSFLGSIFKGALEMVTDMFKKFAEELGLENLAGNKGAPSFEQRMENRMRLSEARTDNLEVKTGTPSIVHPFIGPKKQIAH